MTLLVNALSVIVAVAGVLAGFAIAARTHDVRTAMRSAVELWTAAGALHLAGDAGWSAIGTAASLLAVRKLVGVGLTPTDGSPHA